MVNVAIIGASGYTGGELLRLLLNHPEVEVSTVTSRSNESKPIETIHHHLQDTGLVFENKEPGEFDEDIIFTATPHGASMKIIPDLYETTDAKIIDLSGDYRFDDYSVYEKWYHLKHTEPIPSVYGLPEIHREEIKKSRLIGNPGCFTTGAILSGYPLSKHQLADRMIFDSKTGVSGAGISPSETTHYPNIADNVNPYKVTTHRHTPEIQQELQRFSDVKISFTPILVPVERGILTTNHVLLSDDVGYETKEEREDLQGKITEIYKKEYKDEPFVKILENGEIPRLSSVRGSNYIHIGCFEVDETGQLVVISAIDNLVKGAAGQAIQNMNIMCGFDEKAGLNLYGLHP
ncbi:N-acetyl-gamma-glutamyl-phosphate reductase [uncultured Methanobrevibacter sp.]|uniref:N-acetyl-gamma-glutamyl-phosphate reductase n=1 Tax=uncultured Methanobrevibacter sp. TaxID=253161 RepID=UPI00258A9CAF|nr:N-acetyl-gamma-glutamyl-phosphate reductase [uncultured Methanobrevibacter sp.]